MDSIELEHYESIGLIVTVVVVVVVVDIIHLLCQSHHHHHLAAAAAAAECEPGFLLVIILPADWQSWSRWLAGQFFGLLKSTANVIHIFCCAEIFVPNGYSLVGYCGFLPKGYKNFGIKMKCSK